METKYKDLQWHKQNDLFLLKSNNETLITLNYKLGGKSTFSILSINYQCESKGFINQKLVVTANQQKILEVKTEFWGSNSILTFADGTLVKQGFKHNGKLALRYFNHDGNILVCSFETIDRKIKQTFSVGDVFFETEKFLILAALGMITFRPFIMEISGGADIIPIN